VISCFIGVRAPTTKFASSTTKETKPPIAPKDFSGSAAIGDHGLFPKFQSNREPLSGSGANENEFAWVNSGDRAYRADGEIYVTAA